MTDKEFARRLEILEHDNRRLKRLSVTSMVIFAALGAIYAVACSSGRNATGIKPDAEKITTREINVVDNEGKVRVHIAVNCPSANNCRPEIKLMDQGGKPVTSLGAGTMTVSGEKGAASLLGDCLKFSVGTGESVPRVTAELGSGSGGGGLLSLFGNDGGYVRVNANSPSVEIRDSQGYMMDLGAVDLTTVISGQTSRTTADSIVMFANDSKHHMIWRAP